MRGIINDILTVIVFLFAVVIFLAAFMTIAVWEAFYKLRWPIVFGTAAFFIWGVG